MAKSYNPFFRRVSDYVCKSSGLPEWMISKCQKPVKAETLALTGFRHFEQVNQAVQREFSDNLFTQILWHSLFFRLSGFTLSALYFLFRSSRTLLLHHFMESHDIIKEKSGHIGYPAPYYLLSYFHSDKVLRLFPLSSCTRSKTASSTIASWVL